MAAHAAMTERHADIPNQHAFRGDVIGNAAIRACMVGAKRSRFAEKGRGVGHAVHSLCIVCAAGLGLKVSRIYFRRSTREIIAIAPSTRKASDIAMNTRPYGPMIRAAAMMGGSIGMESLNAHATAAPAAAAVHNFAT